MKKDIIAAFVVLLLWGQSISVEGSDLTLVVPRHADGTHSPHGASTFRDAWRYQQVYGSVEFPPQPILIRELRFRPCATYGGSFTTTVANIQFNLSTTTRNPQALSSTLAQNLGAVLLGYTPFTLANCCGWILGNPLGLHLVASSFLLDIAVCAIISFDHQN